MRSRVLAHLRGHMIRGLLLVLPLLITLWLLRILFGLIDRNVTPLVLAVIEGSGAENFGRLPVRLAAPIVGVLLTVVFIYLLGRLAGNLVGRRILGLVESWILRIPFIKGVYGSAKQLLDAFSVTSSRAFTRVVAVEYPRHGIWTVGFVTNETEQRMTGPATPFDPPCVAVFLPTTPNPTSGWLALVPRNQLTELDISIEEGVKLIVSGGIVSPAHLRQAETDGSHPSRPSPSV